MENKIQTVTINGKTIKRSGFFYLDVSNIVEANGSYDVIVGWYPNMDPDERAIAWSMTTRRRLEQIQFTKWYDPIRIKEAIHDIYRRINDLKEAGMTQQEIEEASGIQIKRDHICIFDNSK